MYTAEPAIARATTWVTDLIGTPAQRVGTSVSRGIILGGMNPSTAARDGGDLKMRRARLGLVLPEGTVIVALIHGDPKCPDSALRIAARSLPKIDRSADETGQSKRQEVTGKLAVCLRRLPHDRQPPWH